VLRQPIRNLLEAGVPIISVNSGYNTFATLPTLAHVGMDDFVAGREAGQAAVIFGAVRAMCIYPSFVNAAYLLRCSGFRAGMQQQLNATSSPWFTESPSVVLDMLADFDPAAAAGSDSVNLAVLQLLADHPDINFIMLTAGRNFDSLPPLLLRTGRWNSSATDPTAFVSNSAHPLPYGGVNPPSFPYSANNPLQPLLFATFDSVTALSPLLNLGLLTFAIVQQERLQGWLPLMLLAVKVLTGASFSPDGAELLPSGPSIITQTNISTLLCSNKVLCDPPVAVHPEDFFLHARRSPLARLRSLVTIGTASLDNCPVPRYSGDGHCDAINNGTYVRVVPRMCLNRLVNRVHEPHAYFESLVLLLCSQGLLGRWRLLPVHMCFFYFGVR
jgi:hypothetical protein